MDDEDILFTIDGDAESGVAAIDDMMASLDGLQAQIDSMADAGAALDGLQGQFETLSAAVSMLPDVTGEASAALDALGASGDTASAALDSAAGSADAITGSLDAVAGSASSASASLDTVAASGEAVSASSASAGESAATGGHAIGMLGLAAAAAGGALIYMGSKAEDSLNQVAALTGASKQQMDQYTAGLQQMAGQMGVSLNQAAQGLYYVVSAGFTGSNALNVLKIAMEGAKAGGADMQTVADALTSSLNAYGASASQAGTYSDTMIEAVTQGKQTFADFAGSIGLAAVTGHTAGFSFQEVAAAEATMTQSGLNAHRAVMQLDFLMRSVGLSADKVAVSAKKLGIDGFDKAKFASMDLIQKLEYLQQITHGNKSAFETLVGGANGLSAAEILLGKNGSTYTGILDKMKTSSGATAQAFATSEQTLSAHVAHAGASLSLLAYHVEQLASPAIDAALGHLTDAFGAMTDFVTQHGSVALPVLAGLAAIIGGALVAGLVSLAAPALTAAASFAAIMVPVGALAAGAVLLAEHWQQVVSFFESSTGPAIAVKAAILGIAAGLAASVAPAVGEFLVSLPAMIAGFWGEATAAGAAAVATLAAAAPFIAVGIAVAGVAAGIMLLVSHWSQVEQFFGNVKNAIGTFFSNAGAFIQAKLAAIGATFNSWGLGLQHLVQNGFKAIQNIIQGAINFVVGLFKFLYDHNYYFQHLVDTIRKDFETVQKDISAIWTFITGWLTATWHKITGTASELWNALTVIIQAHIRQAEQNIQRVWNAVTGFLGGIWNHITGAASSAWNRFTGFISQQQNRAESAAKNVANAVLNPIKNLGSLLFNAGKDLIQHLIDGIGSMVGAVGHAAGNIAGKIMSFLGWHSPTEEGPGAQSHLWMPALGDMLVSGLLAQQTKVAAAAHALAGSIAGSLGTSPQLAMPTLTPGAVGSLTPSLPAGGLGVNGQGDPLARELLQQIVNQLSGRAQPLGSNITPATLGTVTQQSIGNVNIQGTGSVDINTIYQIFNEIAGLAVEYGGRGATAGMGI